MSQTLTFPEPSFCLLQNTGVCEDIPSAPVFGQKMLYHLNWLFPKPGFLSLGTTDILGWMILYPGSYLPSRVSSSIPDLDPLDVSLIHPYTAPPTPHRECQPERFPEGLGSGPLFSTECVHFFLHVKLGCAVLSPSVVSSSL